MDKRRISQAFLDGFTYTPPGSDNYLAYDKVAAFIFPEKLTKYWADFDRDSFLKEFKKYTDSLSAKKANTERYQNSL